MRSMVRKSCENCFMAWLITQVRKKVWSPPGDERAAIIICLSCTRNSIPRKDEWIPIPKEILLREKGNDQ